MIPPIDRKAPTRVENIFIGNLKRRANVYICNVFYFTSLQNSVRKELGFCSRGLGQRVRNVSKTRLRHKRARLNAEFWFKSQRVFIMLPGIRGGLGVGVVGTHEHKWL